jgi:hypothetical protein
MRRQARPAAHSGPGALARVVITAAEHLPMRRLSLLALLGAALVLAGCGGSPDPYRHDQDMARNLQAG